MKTTTLLIAALIAAAPVPLLAQTAASTSSSASSSSSSASSSSMTGTIAEVGAPPPPPVPHQAELIAAVIDYVRNNRGWPDGSYTVSFDSHAGDKLIFSVDYSRGDTTTNFVGNDGMSFRVLVNPVTQKVEQELY